MRLFFDTVIIILLLLLLIPFAIANGFISFLTTDGFGHYAPFLYIAPVSILGAIFFLMSSYKVGRVLSIAIALILLVSVSIPTLLPDGASSVEISLFNKIFLIVYPIAYLVILFTSKKILILKILTVIYAINALLFSFLIASNNDTTTFLVSILTLFGVLIPIYLVRRVMKNENN